MGVTNLGPLYKYYVLLIREILLASNAVLAIFSFTGGMILPSNSSFEKIRPAILVA